MQFIQPQMFFLILPVLPAVILLAIYASSRRKKQLAMLLQTGKISSAMIKLSKSKRRLRVILLLLTMLFLITAAARPFWDTQLIPTSSSGRDLIVLFDVSKSMLSNDIAPSRLEHAKYLLRQLIESTPHDRFGLVAFAGKAYLACPLTSDSMTFSQYIDELDTDTVPWGGTNLEEALKIAKDAFKSAAGNNRGIILFTDGDELTGNSAAAVNDLKEKQIPLFIFGLGDPQIGSPVPEADGKLKRDASGQLVTSKLAEATLQTLAKQTNGIYVRSTVTDTGLAAIEKRIKDLTSAEFANSQRTLPIEQFPLALIAAAICLILYFLISERPRESKLSRPKSVALLLGLTLFLGQNSAIAQEDTAPTAAQTPEALPVNAENTRSTLDEDYNHARSLQIAGDAQAVKLYEKIIRDGADRPDLQVRSLYNLGTNEHKNARSIAQQAADKVKSEQIDAALEELKKAQASLKSAEDLYCRSMEIPQGQDTLPQASNNLQLLSNDRQKVEELQKKLEELQKLQQQAREQTQQAQQQNQKERQNQQQNQQQNNQQQQDKQPNNNQPQQNQQQDKNQQQSQSGNQQQNQSQNDSQSQPKDDNQSSAQKAIDQARQSAQKLKDKAQDLQQQQLSQQADSAKQELDKAQEARQQQKFDDAQKHLENAAKALGNPKPNKEKSTQDKEQKDNSQATQKQPSPQEQAKEEKEQKSGENQSPAPAKPEKGKMDEKTAEQLLKMMAEEEKGLRDTIKQQQRRQLPKVEKDW